MYATKRAAVLALIAVLLCSPASPQESGRHAKEDSLYSVALFASLAEMDRAWGHIDDSYVARGIRTDYHHMPVEADYDITEALPSQVGDYHVEYLDYQGQVDRCKKLRKQFAILKIHPMQNEGASLKILISVYYLTYEKHRLFFGLSDWSDVEFRYDPDKQKFVVSAVKLGGI